MADSSSTMTGALLSCGGVCKERNESQDKMLRQEELRKKRWSTNLKAHKSTDRQVCKVAENRVKTRHGATSRMHTATKVDLRQVGWDSET